MKKTNNIKLMDDIMVTVHDKDFNITHANATAIKTLKLPDLDDAKVKCYEYYHGQSTPPQKCPVYKCALTGEPQNIQMFEPHLRKHVLIKVIPCFDSNADFVGAVHFTSDVDG